MPLIYGQHSFSYSDLQYLNGSHFGFFLFALIPTWIVIETSSLVCVMGYFWGYTIISFLVGKPHESRDS